MKGPGLRAAARAVRRLWNCRPAAVSAARAGADRLSAEVRALARGWASRAAAPFFRPDVVIAPDPLAPDPRLLAEGLAAAVARCASDARPLKVLLARAPGVSFAVSLHAANRTCTVERLDPPAAGTGRAEGAAGSAGAGLPARAERKLPPFTPGASPSVFALDGDGDDVRMRLNPPARAGFSRRDDRVRVSFA